MLSERDEPIYHEMMAHAPLFVHPTARSVLIIGGGDGGTAREVLRHQNVERCVMVEIDAMVVEASRQFLPQTASCLSDPRLELIIDDGVKFMAESSEKFDVILIDSTDPVGPAQPLFGHEFYRNVEERLNKDGIVVAQGESVFYELAMQSKLAEITSSLFKYVSPFNFTNMTYPGGLWSFLWASKTLHPLKDLRAERVDAKRIETFYYNEQIHRAAFALPNFQKRQLHQWIKI